MADSKKILAELAKEHGAGIAAQGVKYLDVTRLPSGVFAFDLATGGGFPRGRISILYGMESSLKTTLALLAIANAQKLEPKKKCVFVDLEASYEPSWAEKLGVNNEQLIYVLPEHAEQAVDIVEAFLYAEDVSVLVLDSIAALVTSRELDQSAEKADVGGSGLVVGKLYRKSTLAMNQARREGREPVFIAINQVRYKIGVMYGDPETMPGGQAFKFASSLTVRLYGKDEMDKQVNPVLPAWKHVSGIVKKWKAPIVARSFEFNMATIPNKALGLEVGQTADWNTIAAYMKKFGFLRKDDAGKGWLMFDTVYKTLEECKAKFYDDEKFGWTARAKIIETAKTQGAVPEGDDEAPVI